MRIWLSLLLLACSTAWADDFAALCADRAAVERVYYSHLLGEKPPFDQATPPSLIERLVKTDQHKEAVLQRVYGVEITPAMLDAEVRRINTTTRAPATLAELKAALGNDPARFARTVARPILVERRLREKFDNDDALHAPRRRAVEQARNNLLAAKTNGAVWEELLALLKRGNTNAVTETTWQFGASPEATNPPDADEMEIKKRFGPNAELLSPPHNGGAERKFYFEDLPPDLQRVLRVQLHKAGDVSAVIETPGGFLLYLAKEKTADTLSVATLSLGKRSYEDWLKEQTNQESSPGRSTR
jgi:hypothetical protein